VFLPALSRETFYQFEDILKKIIDLGIIIFSSAGNKGVS
jgi:hypothetical protein